MAGRARVRNPQSKAAIVAAAERVVAEHGAAHLTLDAVAEAAGMSKGGLLYNFPTKHALLAGMVETMIAHGLETLESVRAQSPAGPGAGIRCRLACILNKGPNRAVIRAVLAAAAENPQLLNPIKALFTEAHEDIVKDATDPVLALIVWLAADALLMREVLGIDTFDEATRGEIEHRLAAMVGLEVAEHV